MMAKNQRRLIPMLNTTQWDNKSIYKGFCDPQIALDIESCKQEILWLEKECAQFKQASKLDEKLVKKTQAVYLKYLRLSGSSSA
jgi:hypothetical protein